jgi:hypothetical protein
MLADETIGDATAAVAIDLAIGFLGVPSFLEDEAREKLDEMIGDRIAAEVADLASESETLAEVRGHLGSAEVESEWLLDGSRDRERVLSISVETDEAVYTLDLFGLDPVAEVSGPLAIAGDGATREVETHGLAIAAGDLIYPLAEAAVADALATVDCAALAAIVVGDDGEIVFSVGGFSYTVTAADLESSCLDQLDDLGAAALARLGVDIRIELGGPIALFDDTGDGVADRIASADGYAGLLLGLPLPIAIAMTGQR